MSSRLLLPLFTVLALFATACGGSTETTTAADEPAAIESAEESEVPEESSAPETTAAPETTDAPEDVEPDETASTEGGEAELTGQEVYTATCATCHGVDGVGTRGPDLVGIGEKRPDKATAIELATNGGTNMPAFGGKHTPAEIAAVVDFVYAEWPAPAS